MKVKTLELNEVRTKLRAILPRLRERYGVRSLALFGSVARGTAHSGSDVDIVVDLEEPVGLPFFALQEELEKVLHARVDLVTYETLRRARHHTRVFSAC